MMFLKSPKRRADALRELDHFRHLDPRFVITLPASACTPFAIRKELVERGAPDACWAVSSDPAIDGTKMELSEALDAVVGSGLGTLLSCLVGRLAYYESEEAEWRCILARRGP